MIDEENVPAYDEHPTEDSPWLTTSEVMALLKVSRSTLANWRRQGRLQAYRVGFRSVRYNKSELTDLINEANSTTRI